ncbi:MAG: hypothetical protein EOP56_07490 [Sphingobacteriales bacterium]|nr:MAG: hypothetical protein EOP56_07490 [Sphingobacteriales bacterium]
MAFLGSQKLIELITNEKVILPNPDTKRVKGGAYELSLGNEAFTTDSKDKRKEIFSNNGLVTINPGQFALLLTYEEVDIPLSKIAFISIKAGVKLRGLVNVSGFHVDPGFKGNLVFSVYNAGTSPISLEVCGEPYFLIWFAELQLATGETTVYNGDHKNQKSIPPKYIDALIAGELASPVVLSRKIEDNYKAADNKIGILNKEIDNKIDKHEKEIDNRLNKHEKEVDNRLDKYEKDIEGKISLLEKEQTAKDYLVKTAVGLGVIILMKIIFDYFAYDNGVKKGAEFKQMELKSQMAIEKLRIQERAILIEIDSLRKYRDSAFRNKGL